MLTSMSVPFFLVDAFCNGPFSGNPAGVCLCTEEPDPLWMAKVANEINQAETAFVWPNEGKFGLRWFTPTVEVDLCGHATLATAHVLTTETEAKGLEHMVFVTKSGELACSRKPDRIELNFPSLPPRAVDRSAIGVALSIDTVWEGENGMDLFCEIVSEEQLKSLHPNMETIAKLGARGLIVTSPATSAELDYCCRFFAPQSGVDEDHVTGSAHCALAPYWREKSGKTEQTGVQMSPRGGIVKTLCVEDRVNLWGEVRTVVRGTLTA